MIEIVLKVFDVMCELLWYLFCFVLWCEGWVVVGFVGWVFCVIVFEIVCVKYGDDDFLLCMLFCVLGSEYWWL